MARKLKTYVTTSGFYDLAVAAPSMKAALEIWGSKNNLFHQGFAKETDDPDVVNATMAKPGIVLRRGVGTKAAFSEEADLPQASVLQRAIGRKRLEPVSKKSKTHQATSHTAKRIETPATRKAAQLYDFAEKRREREGAREAAKEKKDTERRALATERARSALDEARDAHDERIAAIASEREALDRKTRKEEERWGSERSRLEAALDRARE